MIEVRNLNKQYKVHIGRSGLKGSFLDLFSREYKYIQAVKDVSFSIKSGEIVGYIGLNGAGKSTTIKILTGIMHPTSGEVRVNGIEPFKNKRQHAYNIGVIFGQRTQLWWDLAVIESFELLRNMYDVPKDIFTDRLKWMNEMLNFNEILNQQVRKLSLGQRMLCEIAASFIHNPKIIFLDEPTIGLDIIVKAQVHKFIKEINRKYGTTFIITTHDINDIEKLCDRILIIDKGSIIYDGTQEDIYTYSGNDQKIIFELDNDTKLNELNKVLGSDIEWRLDKNKLIVSYSSNKIKSRQIIERVFVKYDSISDFVFEKESLEDTIRKIYKQQAK